MKTPPGGNGLTADPLIGRQLGPFRVDRILGRGGMAQVYYGWDVKLNRPVAIKVIDARYRDDPSYAKRFVQEAQSVATWNHENIIKVYYGDDQDGLYYYAMEFIDGRDLAQLLAAYADDHELMPYADVVRIGRVIASALDYAHQRGVVHRDLKPANVMVARDGRVVLGDFGLALDVQQGSLGEAFGSPHYMAPEQARRSTDAVPQSDIYSLGVILYEMLTGSVPFDDPSPTTVALQHMTLPPTPPRALNPRLSEAIEAVLLQALSKQPAERYPNGRALMDAVEASLRSPAPTDGPGPERPLSAVPVDERVAEAPPGLPQGWAAPVGAALTGGMAAPADTQPRRPPRASRTAVGLVIGLVLVSLTCLALAVAPRLRGLTGGLPGATGSAPAGEGAEATVAPAAGTATVLFTDGRPFVMLYNENSFYLLNLSAGNSDIAPFAFERLSTDGLPMERFDGEHWTEFYPTIKPGWCMRIEILDNPPYLQPPECFEGTLSTRTPQRQDPVIFWTAREGSHQFRVLWDEQEVGRCEIAAGLCRVFLP